MSTQLESPFLRRFDALWSRLRRVQWGQSLSLTGLLAVAGLGLLIALDYRYELPRGVRQAGLGAVALVVIGWLAASVRRTWRSGTKPRTAAEIERAFPQLGQAVRTTVQFGQASTGDVTGAGVRTALVAALAEDTHARSRPLHLDTVIPTRRLWLTLGCAVAGLLIGFGLAAVNWEWRVAGARALLAETPYTRLAVQPGDFTVDLGQPVKITLQVTGRTDRQVTLFTRPAGDDTAEWIEREFTAAPDAPKSQRSATFVATLDAVKKPLEYRAVAGPAASETFHIRVRYPLALKQIEVELTPPAYTGHPPVKSADGNINAVEGSIAKFAIELDQTPSTASLIVTDLGQRSEDDPTPSTQSIPLEIAGAMLTATLPLRADQKYSILAETAEGQRLPENTYRIRVRPDQAPEVYFEEPRDPLDVHTLAEVLMRIRVRDDFGLSKAGIIFEVNNEEEYPLLAQEFATAAAELKQLGKLTPDTQAALEKVLPLEFFELSMKDSVAYYAFAEDNYPDRPHRTVSDLRFVDIRPFRIQYQILDPLDANGDSPPGPKIATLEELIKRQRFNLNRTMGVERRAVRNEKVDLNVIDSVMQSETEIAQATRELADFLTGLMVDMLADEIQLLLQAEANMLAAVDSLAAGKYPTAVLQERDALKELIEGRDRLREAILKNPKAFQALSAADRRMAQKLRRPKSDKQEAEEVVRRLKQLAQQENQVQMALAGGMNGEQGGGGTPTEEPMPGVKGEQPKDEEPKEPGAKPNDPPVRTEPSEQPSGDDAEKPAGQGAKPAETPMPGQGQGESPNEQPGGGGTGEPKSQRAGGMTPQERRELQFDIALEAQDVEKALGKLKNITDLAKSRMTEATKQADGVMNSLDRGDTPAAREQAQAAAGSFEELAKQVEGLIAQEAAERLAAAQKLASELAQDQQQLAMQTPNPGGQGERTEPSEQPQDGAGKGKPSEEPKPQGAGQSNEKPEANKSDPKNSGGGDKPQDPSDDPQQGGGGAGDKNEQTPDNKPGKGGGKEPRDNEQPSAESLAKQAERNTETGKTIVDILQSVLKSTDPADKDVIAKVDELLRDQKLDETVSRMGALPDQLRDGRFGDAKVLAADSADRWEAAALRLGRAFRQLAAPKLDELLNAEQQLEALRDRMDKLEREQDVVQWISEAGKLLEKLERLKIGDALREELQKLLEQAGWQRDAEHFRLNGGGGWALTDKRAYSAPAGYAETLRLLNEEVQAHIQELILGDLLSGQEEASPPQYQQLVERYYQVLATGANKPSMPARKKDAKP
jgi:hypothetical protein